MANEEDKIEDEVDPEEFDLPFGESLSKEDLEKFESELKSLLNKHNIESLSNTPDFMLAKYLVQCLLVYSDITITRDFWFDPDQRPEDDEEETTNEENQ